MLRANEKGCKSGTYRLSCEAELSIDLYRIFQTGRYTEIKELLFYAFLLLGSRVALNERRSCEDEVNSLVAGLVVLFDSILCYMNSCKLRSYVA